MRTNDPSHPVVEIPVRVTSGEGGAGVDQELEGTPEAEPVVPTAVGLRLACSHPCRGEALFSLDVPKADRARFDVHEASGRRVWSYDRSLSPGTHEVTWSGDSFDGRVPTGVYWGVLRTSKENKVQRIVLMR